MCCCLLSLILRRAGITEKLKKKKKTEMHLLWIRGGGSVLRIHQTEPGVSLSACQTLAGMLAGMPKLQ